MVGPRTRGPQRRLRNSVGGVTFDPSDGYGLCGGMSYAALDTFNAGNASTTPTAPVSPGSVYPPTPASGPVYDYVRDRQLDSLGGGTLPTLLGYQTKLEVLGGNTLNGPSYNTFLNQIRPAVNAGNPIPILLVESKSDPLDDHQVLVTGYFRRNDGIGTLSNGQAVLEIYDPNFPGQTMYLNTYENGNGGSKGLPSRVESSDIEGEDKVASFYGFFSTNSTYTYHQPKWTLPTPTGNLVADPGAEQAPPVPTGYPPEWTTTGAFTVEPYGARGFPASPDPADNSRFFAGGPDNASSSAEQTIPLTSDAAQIDGGHGLVTLSAELGGFGHTADDMTVTATFLNGSAASLGSLTIGPVTAADRDYATAMLPRSAGATVPVGTRAIRVTMNATGTAGSYDNAFADDLSVTLTKPAIIPVRHFPIPGPRPLAYPSLG